MTRLRLTRRSAIATLVVGTVVMFVGLLVAGLQTIQGRTYSVRVPDSGIAGTASPSHRLCEGPVQTPSRASGAGVFVVGASGRPRVTVTIFSGGRLIASGSRRPNPTVREQIVVLDQPIPAQRPVQVCVGASGGTLTVYGAGAQAPAVVTHGVAAGMQFSFVLTHPTTLIGALPQAFSRAAIFRPSWVGSWTFWLLFALLAGTVALAGIALTGALDEPEVDESSYARDGSS